MHSICSACAITRRRLDFEVDYAGTGHLLKKPLVPCKNPKILYDLKNLSLFLTLPDMLRVVDHLAEHGCTFLSNLRRADSWVLVHQNAAQAKATIENGRYLFIYAMPDQIEVPEDQANTNKKEDAFWKRSELIRIGSKRYVCTYQRRDNLPGVCYSSDPPTDAGYTEIGLSFYIDFSNEFVRGEQIIQKSTVFRKVTASLLTMLQDNFVSWRSSFCFDNPAVNVRIFGDRFRKKLRAKAAR